MPINSKFILPISDAEQNFSKAAELADQEGLAILTENGSPKYLILPITDELHLPEEELREISPTLPERCKELLAQFAE